MGPLTKNHYSGGFLYHPESQKILLQQDSSDPKSVWTLLGSANGKDFAQVVSDFLQLKLSAEAVLPIYDYTAKGEKHVIVYAEVKNQKDFPKVKNFCFAWFTLKEISKLPLSAQTKQDLIVGRRVIDSQIRQDAGERTIG